MSVSIHFQSDFKLFEKTTADYTFKAPFRFVYYTIGSKTHIAAYDGREYTNCKLLADGGLSISFDNHGLAPGRLMCRREFFLTDDDFKDGVSNAVLTSATDVFLTLSSDDLGDITTMVPPFYQKGDKGEPFTWDDMTAEQRAYFIEQVGADVVATNNAIVEAEAKRVTSEEERTLRFAEAITAAEDATKGAILQAETAASQAIFAFEKGTQASQLGKEAKENGDYAKTQGDYATSGGQYARRMADYAQERGVYASGVGALLEQTNAAVKSEENQRKRNEDIRNDYEQSRINAELLRDDAEAERVRVEGLRVEAELERDKNERRRIEEEASRTARENAIKEAEAIRVRNESLREEQELTRKSEEAGRLQAEIARAAAEEERNRVEIIRNAEETDRSEAEAARKANEAARQQAEEKRQTDTAKAIEDTQAATQKAENIVDTLEEFKNETTERVDELEVKIDRVFDGGRADSVYGPAARVVNCGGA